MFQTPVVAASAILFSAAVLAQSNIPTCGAGNNCPDNLPCCSQYGQCGVGAYCLGGCDPISSHSIESCVPAPACNSQNYKLTSLSGITANTQYLGDSSKSRWVSSGEPVVYHNNTDSSDQVLLTMKEGTVGTLLASTSYVWYGKVSATLKTSRTAGVVTAFILLSDVKDEIDFEFVGTDLNEAQSNFYFQGITNYENEKNISIIDTFGTYHTYTIDWNPDVLTWSIDGTPHRTLLRNETWNSTDNQYHYPQTPARIQLSLWPAGLMSNGQGTVAWSGGLVNWNAPDPGNTGYFYAMVNEVDVECYSSPSGAKGSGSISYIYDSITGTNNTVELSNNPTILKSQLGTGTNMSAAIPSASASNVPTVPGLSGVGTGSNGLRGGDSGSSASSGSGSSPSETSTAAGSASTGFHGFAQNPSSMGSSRTSKRALLGSLLAAVVAVTGILAM